MEIITIKAYTDLKQSKKLAEILPIESADMFWKNGISDKYIQCFAPFVNCGTDMDYDYDVPCWSLAALLNILPILDDRNANFCKDIRHDKWHVFYHSTTTSSMIDTERYDNLIDAVFEMILKLHELKKIV